MSPAADAVRTESLGGRESGQRKRDGAAADYAAAIIVASIVVLLVLSAPRRHDLVGGQRSSSFLIQSRSRRLRSEIAGLTGATQDADNRSFGPCALSPQALPAHRDRPSFVLARVRPCRQESGDFMGLCRAPFELVDHLPPPLVLIIMARPSPAISQTAPLDRLTICEPRSKPKASILPTTTTRLSEVSIFG